MRPCAKTYNHLYEICFEISGSTDMDGEDVTEEQIEKAIRQRLDRLIQNGELLEAVGGPVDTYEEGNGER